MKKNRIFSIFAALALMLVLAEPAFSAPVGRVISVRGGVVAERGAEKVPLSMKSAVFAKDVLKTDATGRVQVLFDDDTTVALGSGASLALEEVVPTGSQPEFRARVGQGVARFITGRIVEKNPNGFAVHTPDATVGIRGTIFIVDVSNNQTTVFVINTNKGSVDVGGVQVPSMSKITLPGGAVSPMTAEDMARTQAITAARSETSGSAGTQLVQNQAPGDITSLPEIATLPLLNELAGDSFQFAGQATISGSLTMGVMSGQFTFDADLTGGQISNAAMFGYDTIPGVQNGFSLVNGSGTISGSNFDVGNFYVDGKQYGGGLPGDTGVYSSVDRMSGTMTLASDGGIQVSGQVTVDFSNVGGPAAPLSGTIAGSSNGPAYNEEGFGY